MIRFLQKESQLTKIIFAGVIGAAILAMVVTLVPGVFGDSTSDGSSVYATIKSGGIGGRYFTSNSTVSTQQVNAAAQRILTQQKLPPMLLPYVVQRAASSLVQQEILVHEAERLGLNVSDADLRGELQSGVFGQYLFPNGQFIGEDGYTNFVQNAFGMAKTDFETELKKDMEVNRLESMIAGGVTVSDSDVRDSYMSSGTKVKFDYAFLTLDDVKKQINPADAELQSFYKQNAAKYAKGVPESRKLEFVAFDPSQAPGANSNVGDAQVEQYYNQHRDTYSVKDQVRVRHILIKVPAGADAATDTAAKNKADDILKQIKAGGDFADLAKKNSDDPGSKEQGGELGFLQHGVTVPEFDKTAFQLAPGQTSGVLKTQFGYHILQVEEKQAAHVRSLDEVKNQIKPLLIRQNEMQAAQTYAQQLVGEIQKQGFDKTAAAHSLKTVTTDYLVQGSVIPEIPDGAPMLTAAFAAKPNAPQVVTTGEGYAVFSVIDSKAAHAPSFDEYKTHVLDDFREQQAPGLLGKKVQELADRAHAGNDLAKAAREAGATLKTSDLVGKDGQVPDIGSLAQQGTAIFALNQGQISGPLNNGHDGFVVKIDEKQQPTADDVVKNLDKTRETLLQQKREQMFSVFVSDLQTKYESQKRIVYNKSAQAALEKPQS